MPNYYLDDLKPNASAGTGKPPAPIVVPSIGPTPAGMPDLDDEEKDYIKRVVKEKTLEEQQKIKDRGNNPDFLNLLAKLTGDMWNSLNDQAVKVTNRTTDMNLADAARGQGSAGFVLPDSNRVIIDGKTYQRGSKEAAIAMAKSRGTIRPQGNGYAIPDPPGAITTTPTGQTASPTYSTPAAATSGLPPGTSPNALPPADTNTPVTYGGAGATNQPLAWRPGGYTLEEILGNESSKPGMYRRGYVYETPPQGWEQGRGINYNKETGKMTPQVAGYYQYGLDANNKPKYYPIGGVNGPYGTGVKGAEDGSFSQYWGWWNALPYVQEMQDRNSGGSTYRPSKGGGGFYGPRYTGYATKNAVAWLAQLMNWRI